MKGGLGEVGFRRGEEEFYGRKGCVVGSLQGKGGEPVRYEGELVRLVLVEGGVVR